MEGPARKPSKKIDGYIRKEASDITQIPARTIQYYTDRGFVTPDVAAPTGRGTTRRYSLKNLVELSLVKELSGHGYTLEKIEKIMGKVSGSLDKYWNKSSDIALVTDLFLILLRPGTKHPEAQLCQEEGIDLPLLIIQPSFSVIRLTGVILKILEAGLGTSKFRAYLEYLERSKYTEYSEEEVAGILEETESHDEREEVEVNRI
ncbi:MAG: MerR family transcriptional regulator [Deltaproteobacteria bacterium]|nr:MerR family transcriptional regulator [Deltaproteobacteria bacterium]